MSFYVYRLAPLIKEGNTIISNETEITVDQKREIDEFNLQFRCSYRKDGAVYGISINCFSTDYLKIKI